MNSNTFVLDTSAVLTYIAGEQGSDRLEQLLCSAKGGNSASPVLLMDSVSLSEVYSVVRREANEEKANQVLALVKNWDIKFVPVDEVISLLAVRIRSVSPISGGDAYALATAQLFGATLVTNNPQLGRVVDSIKVLWLVEPQTNQD